MAGILRNILNNIIKLIQKMGNFIICTTTATGTSPDRNNPEVSVSPGSATVSVEDPNPHLTVVLETTSLTPETGYVLGEIITYKVTVMNDGSVTIEDITVTDELTGDEWTIESLASSACKEFTCEYAVTEADILSGVVENTVTANGTPKNTEAELVVEPGLDTEPTDAPNAHITIDTVVDSEPENGEAYTIGEKVVYRTTVTNDGNLTITNITVLCELTGDQWAIAAMTPGEQKEFFHEYAVTENDIL